MLDREKIRSEHMAEVRKTIGQMIKAEMGKAVALHPVWPADLCRQILIVQEELGEAVQAVNDHDASAGLDTLPHVVEEVVQTATMCHRLLENLPLTVLKQVQSDMLIEQTERKKVAELCQILAMMGSGSNFWVAE